MAAKSDEFIVTSQTRRRLAWLLWALAVVAGLVSLVMQYVTGWGLYEGTGSGFRSFSALGGWVYGSVGLILIVNRPRHSIGWLLGFLGLLMSGQALILEVAVYAQQVVQQHSLARVLFWVLTWDWLPFTFGFQLLLLLYPTGKLPSARWRWIVLLITVLLPLRIMLQAMAPGPLGTAPEYENPVDFTGVMKQISNRSRDLRTPLDLLTFGPVVVAPFVRFRHARGLERQQLKWFAYTAAVLLAIVGLNSIAGFDWLFTLVMAAFLVMPLTIGLAVMRYRLYDIDLIIRRTLIYAVLSAALAAIYFGSVIAFQAVLTALTGQQSPIAVVLSTLIIAGLFNPMRQRVQALIDRRLYRRKYDAAQTLARFAATARDEVDLDQLNNALLQAVDEAMQPDQITLWLRQKAGEE